MGEDNICHWADAVVKRVITEKGDKNTYVCAAGITPSGTVHIGNFREMITVELVVRAFKKAGKKARFIYSWDDYDVFRKVPKNMPKQEMLEKHLRLAIVDIPDPFGKEESYARHHEVAVENSIAKLGINPEFLYQAKKYRAGEYAENIKIALQNKDKIKAILNEHRKEPLEDDWIPLSGYCPDCKTDHVHFLDYDGKYSIKMKCNPCNKEYDIDIRKAPFIKLPWRIDWPMRWAYEKVDFEPGGKDHSTVGGSYTTAKEIVSIFGWTAPTYQMYDFISIKGAGGKISSSTGDVITTDFCLEIYEPAIVRWLFAGTRPNAEFAISFDLDVIKIYEDFDKCERIFYGEEKAKNEKELNNQKRIYELSCPDKPAKKMPFQPSFRHLTNVLQTNSFDMDKIVDFYKDELKTEEDKKRLLLRAGCAKNWLEKYAPDEFKYEVQKKPCKELNLSKEMKTVLKTIAKDLKSKEWDADELHQHMYDLVKDAKMDTGEFFKSCYMILIKKEKGPKLANFMLIIGRETVADLLSQI